MIVLIAIVCYALVWATLIVSMRHREKPGLATLIALPVALLLHYVACAQLLYSHDGVAIGLFQMAALLFAVMNTIVALSSLRVPLMNLFAMLLPLTVLSLILAKLIPSGSTLGGHLGWGMVVHILLSIVAYSLLTIATLQAILLNYQNSQLKSHHVKSVLGIFPPLQTMETLLFDLVWAGFVVLTLSIGTGVYFLEDMHAQQLTHKFAFSLISWVLYATLLIGRHQLGWRGRKAIRWVIAGFVMLMLAYFGSKFVIEFLLDTP